MWWALIEEIASHAEEMAGEKEMAYYVRGYHVYKDILAAAIGDFGRFLFSAYEDIFTMKKSELR